MEDGSSDILGALFLTLCLYRCRKDQASLVSVWTCPALCLSHVMISHMSEYGSVED